MDANSSSDGSNHTLSLSSVGSVFDLLCGETLEILPHCLLPSRFHPCCCVQIHLADQKDECCQLEWCNPPMGKAYWRMASRGTTHPSPQKSELYIRQVYVRTTCHTSLSPSHGTDRRFAIPTLFLHIGNVIHIPCDPMSWIQHYSSALMRPRPCMYCSETHQQTLTYWSHKNQDSFSRSHVSLAGWKKPTSSIRSSGSNSSSSSPSTKFSTPNNFFCSEFSFGQVASSDEGFIDNWKDVIQPQMQESEQVAPDDGGKMPNHLGTAQKPGLHHW